MLEKLKRVIGSDQSSARSEFRCNECGETFVSAKQPERAQCMECLSKDVERLDDR